MMSKRRGILNFFRYTFLICIIVFGYMCIVGTGGSGDGGGGGGGQTFTLTVTMNDAGNGRVTSSSGGIICETDCSEAYNSGTQVTLTASPYSGFVFAGWSGGSCSGTGTCALTMNADTSVTATFNLIESDPVTLVTPYVDEADMTEIRPGFSSEKSSSPWNAVHDGLDIFPAGDLKPFQAACSGRVNRIFTFDEQVIVLLACDSTYILENNFETQSPGTGQTQLDNITVVEGQAVSQGDIIGYLYAANVLAHVHFALYNNWVPSCPESYFGLEDSNSILNLIRVTFPSANMCYGADFTPPPLVTPYVNESDMTEIKAGFSSDNSSSPWDFVNEGIDIYPEGDLKPFQAACSGMVDSVQVRQSGVTSNWEVEVLIECDNYVPDPDMGGYFSPFLVNYVFETMSNVQADGQTQLDNITVVEGQAVSQGDIIGYLYADNVLAHVQFGLLQFGALSSFGLPSIAICPEPHFATEDKNSILNLLQVVWPSANMCYQN